MGSRGGLRWRERRDVFAVGEKIRTAEYDVAEILDDTTPRAFVERHHYSGSYPAARFRFGLYRHGELAGVAVFSHPCNDKVLSSVFPDIERMQAAELGRFVLLDEVAGNGETWFLSRAFELLRGRLAGVVSFSDPVARATLDGRQVFPGHVGTIYQASNARHLGRSTARTLRLPPDGRVLSDRVIQKIRKLERAWRPAAAELIRLGADPVDEDAPGEWVRMWLPRLTRTMRHPGNLRYAFGLTGKVKRGLPAGEAYPKARDLLLPRAA